MAETHDVCVCGLSLKGNNNKKNGNKKDIEIIRTFMMIRHHTAVSSVRATVAGTDP